MPIKTNAMFVFQNTTSSTVPDNSSVVVTGSLGLKDLLTFSGYSIQSANSNLEITSLSDGNYNFHSAGTANLLNLYY